MQNKKRLILMLLSVGRWLCHLYRLIVNTEKDRKLGIKIPRIFTSYKLWVNEELIAAAGTVDKSRETMIPSIFHK